MAERVFINDLNPITDILAGSKILVDQNGYKKMFYDDFVLDIANTLKADHGTGWNADIIGGVNVSIEAPQQGEVLIFNSSSSEFENRRIDSNDIDWSSISVNEYKFLQVGSGGIVEQDFVTIPSLRIDNDTSSGYFLRVKSGNRQIEAVPFDPDEFTINAQTLEGNAVSDLDDRYLRVTNDLQDINDVSVARNSLSVLSESESDNRYLFKSNNLSDISNTTIAFNNIKQLATPSFAGVIEIATSPEVQDGLRSDVAVVPSTLSDNYYNKQDSDIRFLNSSNNLNDIDSFTIARQNLNVYSSIESDNRYLQKSLNLSELTSKSISRDNLEVYSRNYIDGVLANISGVVIGTVIMYPDDSVPDGYLKCNGALLNESTYPELFSVIGRTYGGSAGNGTFRLPDLRGEFVRGWDDGRGVDSGRTLGSFQSESFKSHSHSASSSTSGIHSHLGSANSSGSHSHSFPRGTDDGVNQGVQTGTAVGGSITSSSNGGHSHSLSINSSGSHSHTITVDASGGSETRPRNVALMFCIKY